MDALFTLQPAARRPTDGLGASVGGGDASAVTGVCFVRDPTSCEHGVASPSGVDGANNSDDGECSDDESSDDDSQPPLQFRCSNFLLGPRNRNTADAELQSHRHASHLSAASHNFLSGGVLASCHHDGSCKLWDLATRRTFVDDICKEDPRGGAGLAVRRVGGGDAMHRFLYHTRDPLGTVSLHDLERPDTPVLQMHTHSTSFCAMAPCHCSCNASIGGETNLVALPTEEHSVAAVRDLRCDPEGNPAWRVPIGDEYISGVYGSRRKYGMLTSLALCHQESTRNVVLGCGTESGTVLFYDLGAVGRGRDPWRIEPGAGARGYDGTGNSEVIAEDNSLYTCGVSLGKDPVLTLDLCSSSSKPADSSAPLCNTRPSLVAVGGCAGDADDLSELPEDERGTVSTIKVKLADDESSHISSNSAAMRAAIRARTSTCSISSGGKVGVSICRFRPDGRIFAVGGWDHRLRLFGRTSSKPLAILRGHEESVTAMDWAGNSSLSGLLATGAGDGRICVWRAFPHSTAKALLP